MKTLFIKPMGSFFVPVIIRFLSGTRTECLFAVFCLSVKILYSTERIFDEDEEVPSRSRCNLKSQQC